MADPKITLTAVDQTGSAFRSAIQNIDNLKAKAAGMSAAFAALPIAGLAAGVISSFKGAVELGDQFNKLSQKVGIGVERLSELKFAAELSDVSIEQFQIGMKGLNDTLVKANDATSKEAALLKTLGVTAKDPANALRQVSDAFAALPDGATKSTLAVELFGKAGQAMIPMLNGGSKALDEAASSARKLGLVMSAETAKAAEEFNDNMTKLSRSTEALGISLTGKIIGGLAEFTRGLVQAKEEGQLLSKVLSDMVGTGLELSSKLPGIGAAFSALRDANAERVARNEQRRATSESIISGAQSFSQRFGFVGPPLPADLEKRVADLLAKGVDKAKKPTGPSFEEILAQGSLLLLRREDDAVEEAQREFEKNEKERLEFAYDAAQQRARLEDEYIDRVQDALRVNRELRQSYIDLIDPVEKYRRQLADIDKLLESGDLTSDQANIARERVNESVRKLSTDLDKSKDAAKELGLTFSSAFEDAIIGGKKFSEVLKGIGQDIAKIIIRKSITEPLANDISNLFKGDSSSGGGNILGSLFEAGKKLFGFASGGSFTVGGAGGTDSQLVAFKATPGERVTVQTPSQQGGSPQFTFNFTVGVGAEVRSEIMAMLPMIQRAALAGTIDAKRRGVAV